MSVADWKEREKEQRRNDIIGAAQKLFASKGYEGVSMDGIAEEIKLGKATLYRYFKSKESLFYAVVLRGARLHHAMATEKLKKASTGAERLAAAVNGSNEFRRKYPEYGQINNYYYSGRFDVASLIKNADTAHHPLGIDSNRPGKNVNRADYEIIQEISQLQLKTFEIVCDAIITGREDGTIQPGPDAVELAILMSLIADSLSNISQRYRCLMEYEGIDPDRFVIDSRTLVNQKFLYGEPAVHKPSSRRNSRSR